MLQSFWHGQLQLTTRAYITFNVVNGPPGAEQFGDVIHPKNLQVCNSRRSSSGWGLLTMLPSNIRGSDLWVMLEEEIKLFKESLSKSHILSHILIHEREGSDTCLLYLVFSFGSTRAFYTCSCTWTMAEQSLQPDTSSLYSSHPFVSIASIFWALQHVLPIRGITCVYD